METSGRKASELRKILELIAAMNRVYELRDKNSTHDFEKNLTELPKDRQLH